jgi:hypothetical protein
VHAAATSQLCVYAVHSFTSTHGLDGLNALTPVPLPVQPAPQVHVKLPAELAQTACSPQ